MPKGKTLRPIKDRSGNVVFRYLSETRVKKQHNQGVIWVSCFDKQHPVFTGMEQFKYTNFVGGGKGNGMVVFIVEPKPTYIVVFSKPCGVPPAELPFIER